MFKDTKPKCKIWVTGYYKNKQGKRVYGFVKPDARKKQTINIKNLDTNERYKMPIISKRELRKLVKKIPEYIGRGYRSYKGNKIEKIIPKIKAIDFPVSKPFSIRYDKGEYQRIETLQLYDSLSELQSSFFRIFSKGKELNAKIVVPSIFVVLTFSQRLKYRYQAKYFIFARRIDVDLGEISIEKLWSEIVSELVKKIKDIKADYKPKQIQFMIKVHWLI